MLRQINARIDLMSDWYIDSYLVVVSRPHTCLAVLTSTHTTQALRSITSGERWCLVKGRVVLVGARNGSDGTLESRRTHQNNYRR